MKVEIESVTCRVDRFYNASPAVNVSLIGMHEENARFSPQNAFLLPATLRITWRLRQVELTFRDSTFFFFSPLSNRLTDA